MQIKSNDDKLLLNAKIAETHTLDGSLTDIVEFAYQLGVKSENKRIKESLLKAINIT